MPTYAAKWPTYAKQWDLMEIRSNKKEYFEKIARKLIANKARYQEAEKLTGVPWYMIALLHMRESDNNFNTQLAQGDPLNRVSTHVPRGRGPFETWEAGAYDALVVLKNYHKVIDWRLEKILYYSELYNGWGYHNRNVPSAYLWAGSTVYSGGKYVADGVWSSTAVDSQPGVASVLKVMMKLDPSIQPKRETKDDLVTTPVAAASIAGVTATTAAVASGEVSLWPWVIGGSIALILVVWLTMRWLRNRFQRADTTEETTV